MNSHKTLLKYFFTISPYLGVLIGMYIFNNAFLALFIYHIGIITSLLTLNSNICIKNLLKINNKKIFILVSLICLLSGIIFYFIWGWVKIDDYMLIEILNRYGLFNKNIWLFIIYFSTINPVLEEVFWRETFKPNKKYIEIHDILFGTYHFLVIVQFIKIEFAIITTLALIVISSIWKFIYYKLDEKLIVILSHAIADASIMVSILFITDNQ